MGRKEYEKVTAIQSNPSENVRMIPLFSSVPIPVSTNQKIDIYATAGKIAKMINPDISFPAIASATSGTKSITLALEVAGTSIGVCFVTGAYNTELTISYGFSRGSTLSEPADLTAFQQQLQSLKFDDVVSLNIYFSNDTNGIAVETRRFNVFVAEMKTS